MITQDSSRVNIPIIQNNRRANQGNHEVYSKKSGIYFTNEEM